MRKTDKNTHSFRDSNNLLINLEKGTVSEFIRDSINLRLNIDGKTYIKEQAALTELIKCYKEILEDYNYLIEKAEDKIKKTTKAKKDLKNKLEKLEKEQMNIDCLLEKKRELQQEDLQTKRNQTFKTIISNILSNKEDSTIPLLNIEYLQKDCEFQTKIEFKNELYNYLQNHAKTSDYSKTRITQEDIDYIINKIKEI